MRFEKKEEALTLFFVGEINSNTSEGVAKDVEDTLTGQTFTKLIFDFLDVRYLSSAGLRIILRFKQKYNNLEIINVSMDVYDVFQMTGFTSIINVSRALAKIEVTKDQIIGEGYTSTVYRINKDTIIKVFEHAHDTSDIEREMALAKEAFILGIPTAITFDIVQVGDKYGARFEMLDFVSLRDAFRDNEDRFEDLCQQYASLLKTINTTKTDNPNLPSAKQTFLKKLELVGTLLDKENLKKLTDLAEKIPEAHTFVHGDCHVKNILCQGNELFLIDMDTLSVGNPIFELAGTYATYVAFEETAPGNSEEFLGLRNDLVQKMFRRVLDIYFGGKIKDEDYLKIQTASYAHMVWWGLYYDPENKKRINHCLERLKECLKDVKELAL